jgi:hypothetical protein
VPGTDSTCLRRHSSDDRQIVRPVHIRLWLVDQHDRQQPQHPQHVELIVEAQRLISLDQTSARNRHGEAVFGRTKQQFANPVDAVHVRHQCAAVENRLDDHRRGCHSAGRTPSDFNRATTSSRTSRGTRS